MDIFVIILITVKILQLSFSVSFYGGGVVKLQKFIRNFIISLLIQTILLVSMWLFIFSNKVFWDFATMASALSLALLLFFSSSGDAWTNNVIADSFIVHGDSGYREPRELFHIRVNAILISSLLMLLIAVGGATVTHYVF